MKLSLLKILTITCLAFSSTHVMADLKMDEMIKLAPSFQTIRVGKEKKSYYLEHIAITIVDENGQSSGLGKAGINRQILRRVVKMPVKITVEKIGGLGGKIQFLGLGDDDIKTGNFKNLTNLRFGDLFTTYKGSSTNIGLTVIGGGYTTMTSPTGAILKEGNGSITMIGPTGTPFGINTGFEYVSFNLTISSALKSVLVEYDLNNYGAIAKREKNEKKSIVESFDDVAQFDLTGAF